MIAVGVIARSFSSFSVSEVESDFGAWSFAAMVGIDFRGFFVAVPAYEFFWGDFGVYGFIQPGVSDDEGRWN
ncbi:hypothetical protein [Rossellomorea sp. NRS-1567]|uniref:hypothetical protein n=1 Tax=Rossellomorea sp. NRS-1567 TaxID=3233901 RepID=UPI003D2BC26B